MDPLTYTLLSVVLVSLISFVGAFALFVKAQVLDKGVFLLVALAIGALLGDVFVHIIPEAYEGTIDPTHVSLGIIAGILIFLVLEKALHWHHHTHEHAREHEHPVGNMVLVGDGVHNFIDGIIIAGSYMVSVEVGIATTIAVILHEIPQEIGNFGVLLHAGFSKWKALWYNFLSALTAILGAIVAFVLTETTDTFSSWLLPITAGGFIYIALSDLMPILNKHKSLRSSVLEVLMILLGVFAMLALLALE